LVQYNKLPIPGKSLVIFNSQEQINLGQTWDCWISPCLGFYRDLHYLPRKNQMFTKYETWGFFPLIVLKDGHLQAGPIVTVLFWFKAFMKHLAWLGWVEYVS